MESIPQVLSYSHSSSLFRVNEFAVMPSEGQQNQNGRLTFRLPQKSIINLSSLRVAFRATITGLTAAADNNSNAMVSIPAYSYFRSVQWIVGGTTVCGSSQHYNAIYHALFKATQPLESSRSKLDAGMNALISLLDDYDGIADGTVDGTSIAGGNGAGGITSKSTRLVMSDLLGMRSGNESYIDTSLFGDVQLVLELADTSAIPIKLTGNTTVSGISFNISDAVVHCKAVTSISPLYVEMLANRLQSNQPIKWPFQNYSSTLNSNATGCVLSVNTGCLDLLLCVPYNASPNSAAGLDANQINPPRYKFNSGLVRSSANTFRFQTKINNQYYPVKQVENALDVPSITTESLFGSSDMSAQNLLFLGYTDTNGARYNRSAFLSDNFILVQKLCGIQEGWAGAKQATGISSNGSQMDINIQYQGFGTFQLMCAFYTSYLVYDPSSGSVQLEA